MNVQFHPSPVMRLTFWYTLIIMVISVSFSAIIYRQTTEPFRVGFVGQPNVRMAPGSEFSMLFDDHMRELFIQRYEDVIAQIRNRMIMINLVILGAAGLASYFLAKQTLHPIERALKDQRQFAADASHELRTPLTAMKTEIEVALKDPSPSGHIDILKSNIEEINKLEKLSTALLHLARQEDEIWRPIIAPVELDTLINEAVKQVDWLAKSKNITIVQDGLVGIVQGDHTSLTELIVILLDNAIKYSPAKTTINIHGQWTDRSVQIKVVDQGVGISAEALPHIFKRFYRADASRSKKSGDGHGLGLSIAKQIVDRHHGTIRVASELGKWTTMTVTLPRLN